MTQLEPGGQNWNRSSLDCYIVCPKNEFVVKFNGSVICF